MNKHAYLILAHANPGQLRKLLEIIDDARNDIYVHIDARAAFGPESLEGCVKRSSLQFIEPRIKVHWGGLSIMLAELALLKAATKTGHSYYHLLSGMDLPIKSQDEIHDFFDENDGKEFIRLWPMKSSTPSRFHYYTIFPEGAGSFGTNLVNNIFKGLQMAVGYRMNRDVDFHFGSQWFSITEGLARYVTENEDWLMKVFRHTNTCDEIFLPTLLFKSPYRDNVYEGENPDLRLIDWTRGSSIRHPWVFTEADYDMLKNSSCFWARKFDERVDSGIIDRLWSELRQDS